jgi:hypothetical protein
MSTFEDDIRRAMTDHDDEAPREADLLRSLERVSPPRRRRGGWYVPFAVAVAVAAVVLGSVSVGRLLAGHQQKTVLFSRGTAHATSPGPAPATSRGTAAAVRLTCPAKYAEQAPWVPAQPSGVDGRARLVPQQTPRSALMCAYAGSNTAKQKAGWALSGQRALSGGLADLAGQLSWQPRQMPRPRVICTLMGGAQTNYLIGLTYPGGATMWVAATVEPNECVAASNGEFTPSGVIGPAAAQAFASGRWPARPRMSCSERTYQEIGRLGQEAAMVPAGSTSVTICAPKAHRTITSGYQALARALNRLPTRRSTFTCTGSSGPGSYYRLLFSYGEGPAVQVDISVGCHPAIDNLALQAASASTVMPIVRQLLTAK